MARKTIVGTVASQPVVITLHCNTTAVLLSVKTEKGYKKCMTSITSGSPEVLTKMSIIDSMFSNIALSAIGDKVELEVRDSSSETLGARIFSFKNHTQGFGL